MEIDWAKKSAAVQIDHCAIIITTFIRHVQMLALLFTACHS